MNRPYRNASQLDIGSRVNPQAYYNQESVLGTSLLAQQVNSNGFEATNNNQMYGPPDLDMAPLNYSKTQPRGIPRVENNHRSLLGDAGSTLSPPIPTSILDAKLPASFNSNDQSNWAKGVPIGTSVPSKFSLGLLGSPESNKGFLSPETRHNLKESAYGPTNPKLPIFGSSPLTVSDENVAPRLMHSQRITRPSMFSASVPRPGMNSHWDDDLLLGQEEDRLPRDLFNHTEDRSNGITGRGQGSIPIRRSSNAAQALAGLSNNFGSPSTASPSRFAALFNEQRRKEENNSLGSGFGPVGSPLRNKELYLGSSPEPRSGLNPRRDEPSMQAFSQSPRPQASISALSSQLGRLNMHRSNSNEASSSLYNQTLRNASNPRSAFDRTVSSTSATPHRIEEESSDIFSLEEDEAEKHKTGGSAWNPASPDLGPIGGGRAPPSSLQKLSYASIAANDAKGRQP